MKLTLTEATQRLTEVSQNRYTFELTEWVNQYQKIQCKCLKCEYKWGATYKDLVHKKSGCPKCAGNIKFTLDEIIQQLTEASQNRYTFELTEYKNMTQKIKCKCLKCEHEWETHIYSLINLKTGCFRCRTSRPKHSKDKMAQMLSIACKDRYEWVLCVNNGVESRVKCKCLKCEHEWETNYNALVSQKSGCPRCVAQDRVAIHRFTLTEATQRLTEASNGRYTFELTEYKNAHQRIRCKCNKCGYKWDSLFSQLVWEGTGCPVCVNMRSKDEEKLAGFLEGALKEGISKNNREVITPQELDIICQSKNIAVEFDGLYWHTEQQGKHRSYHKNKTQLCENKKIKLFHIFSNEYAERQDIWHSILVNSIGVGNITIHARKCELKEITNRLANDFCKENHLQGGINSKVNIGAFHKSQLVAVMTFGMPRYNKHYEWELLRFCSLKFHRINGIASRLLAFFKRSYEPTSIISYGNRRWCSTLGNVYQKLGFSLVGVSQPNYFYVKDGRLYSRLEFQKHKLKDKLEIFDEKLSEYENCLRNGIDRIWDCGNLIYAWQKPA